MLSLKDKAGVGRHCMKKAGFSMPRGSAALWMSMLISVATTAAVPPIVKMPPGWSWHSIGSMAFAHTGQPTEYTASDLALLKKFRIVQFDKKENVAEMPGVGAEDRFIAAAKLVKHASPNVQILMYLNALINFREFYLLSNATASDPTLLLHGSDGRLVRTVATVNGTFDMRQPRMRQLFVDAAMYGMSSGAFNGVFIDRANWAEKCASRGGWTPELCASMVSGQRALLAELTEALGEGNITLAKDTSGAPMIDWQVANAAMTSDTFCSMYCREPTCNSTTDPATLWTKADADNCAESIEAIANASARTQLTQSHAMGPFEGPLAAASREFTMAAFLIGAGPLSYFSYARWDTDCWTLSGTKWWPEYDELLGLPTSPPNTKINGRSKYKYARNFSSGTTVFIDVLTREVEIQWAHK